MKNLRLNYLIVGAFVIAAIVGVVVAATLLAGRTGPTDSYYAVYDNVAGVEFGTRVLYEGYPIGQVERVVPLTGEARVRFRVDMSVIEGWTIQEDSVAEIAASGLLAAVAINIQAGDSAAALEPGSQIAARESADVLASVGDLAREIKELTENEVKPMIARIGTVLGGIGEMLGGEDGAMSEDLRAMVETITTTTPQIVENVNAFSARLSRSSEQLDTLLSDENVETMEEIIENLDASATNMTDLTQKLNETTKSIDGLLDEVRTVVRDNRLDVDRAIVEMRYSVDTVARHIDTITGNVEAASRNMMEFSRALRQNPGLLLGGRPPADVAPTVGR